MPIKYQPPRALGGLETQRVEHKRAAVNDVDEMNGSARWRRKKTQKEKRDEKMEVSVIARYQNTPSISCLALLKPKKLCSTSIRAFRFQRETGGKMEARKGLGWFHSWKRKKPWAMKSISAHNTVGLQGKRNSEIPSIGYALMPRYRWLMVAIWIPLKCMRRPMTSYCMFVWFGAGNNSPPERWLLVASCTELSVTCNTIHKYDK